MLTLNLGPLVNDSLISETRDAMSVLGGDACEESLANFDPEEPASYFGAEGGLHYYQGCFSGNLSEFRFIDFMERQTSYSEFLLSFLSYY